MQQCNNITNPKPNKNIDLFYIRFICYYKMTKETNRANRPGLPSTFPHTKS